MSRPAVLVLFPLAVCTLLAAAMVAPGLLKSTLTAAEGEAAAEATAQADDSKTDDTKTEKAKTERNADTEVEAVNYSQHVRPVLSDVCYACHGPDAASRQAGLRLDRRESAFGELDSGYTAVVPGKPDESELYFRITSDDPDIRMPPPDVHKQLKPEQVKAIRRWIEQGAAWEEHWSFVAPTRPELPKVDNADWPRGPIDRFILARLEQENLKPSPPADRVTLLRRVTFDLTGLPPTPEQVEAFLADDSPGAYEKVVDRLLASPHYGEHMARFWLDAVRYADTHGLHFDNYREMWPYRDWVVRALNNNLPYDRFLTWQLAGDLLPDPTLDQLIATGFNRCHVTTNEGGSIKEEVYTRNVVDRTVAAGTVAMGLTMDCTRCHDHKYDPLTQRDFYSMFAFFNSIDGGPMDGNRKDHAPVIRVPTDEQQAELDRLADRIEATQREIAEKLASLDYTDPGPDATAEQATAAREIVLIDDELPAGKRTEGSWQLVDEKAHSGKKCIRLAVNGRGQNVIHPLAEPLPIAEGDVFFAHVWIDEQNPPREIMLQFNDGSWDHRAYWGENLIDWGKDGTASRRRFGDLPPGGEWVRLEVPVEKVGLKPGSKVTGLAITQYDARTWWDTVGMISHAKPKKQYRSLADWLADQRAAKKPDVPKALAGVLKKPDEKLNDAERQSLRAHFLSRVCIHTREQFAPLHETLAESRKQREKLEKQVPTTQIFREAKKPKPAHILTRGEYDQKAEQVERATPEFLPPMPEDAPRDRLGLAQWLLMPEHPLTARVAVNRLWQQVFGTGLVKTAEDFGSQGEPPSHPNLLDWLAVDFRDNGWDVKRLMRQIVTSAAYRQSSRATPELLQRDPENRLLARGPRYRLDAEMLRDQALAVSGLLVEKVGGPPVKPPQPDGLWKAVAYVGSNTMNFKADTGPGKVHRRTLYTFYKRTAVAPQLSTFDAPMRESCVMRRERTNTPLQALLMMNDPQYVECAQALAAWAMSEAGASSDAGKDGGKAEDIARAMFDRCVLRDPTAAELNALVAAYRDHLAAFSDDRSAAEELVGVGSTAPADSLPATELAAWTLIANTLLNMDEVICKN